VNLIIVGGEDYNITGKTDTAELTAFKQFRFFPNASAQYNLLIQSILMSIIIKDNAASTSF
jgi:hypothetical protein